jgi:hypothetical protein
MLRSNTVQENMPLISFMIICSDTKWSMKKMWCLEEEPEEGPGVEFPHLLGLQSKCVCNYVYSIIKQH